MTDTVHPVLDPKPWHDPRPHSNQRDILPWGHAQFLPRPAFSQNVEDYRQQQSFYSAAEESGCVIRLIESKEAREEAKRRFTGWVNNQDPHLSRYGEGCINGFVLGVEWAFSFANVND